MDDDLKPIDLDGDIGDPFQNNNDINNNTSNNVMVNGNQGSIGDQVNNAVTDKALNKEWTIDEFKDEVDSNDETDEDIIKKICKLLQNTQKCD